MLGRAKGQTAETEVTTTTKESRESMDDET
jgi:hypothetical protein